MKQHLTIAISLLSLVGLTAGTTIQSQGLHPEFKREYKRQYLKQEKEAAKKYKTQMKKRAQADCLDISRDAEPISPPEPFLPLAPYLPTMAMKNGICEVRFNINIHGRATHIVANCSDLIYVPSSQQTVAEWWFKPDTVDRKWPESLCGYGVTFRFEIEDSET